MARRNKNGEALEAVVGLTALAPWWVGVVLAVVSYLWLQSVVSQPMPTAVTPNQVSGLIFSTWWRVIGMVGQYLLPVLFLAGAFSSFLKRRQAAQLHSDAANRADGIAQMSWREFEVLVAEHFRRLGFSVTETGGGGPDGGVDVLLKKGSDRYLVQCKHWRARRVGVEPVRELYGVMAAQRMAGGFVVTSGDFTDEARAFAKGRELQLVNGKALQRGIRAQTASAQPPVRRFANASPPPAPVVAPRLVPSCPLCQSDMVLRQARSGTNAGQSFWGCSQFAKTRCRGSRPAE